jgi:hypothetical protein
MLKIVSTLFFLSFILFSFACAAKRVALPVYEGVNVREVLSSKNNIAAIDTTFSIVIDQDNSKMQGDGILNISRNGDLKMRVYSFGFLAFEIISEDGIIKSVPVIDRSKGTLLTYGLRDCLFWWDIDDYEIEEKEDNYILKSFTRTIWIDRKTLFPLKQSIALENGSELNISYENPEKSDGVWYPSKIRIELAQYSVTLRMKDISFIPDS